MPDPASNDERLNSLEQLASLVEDRSLSDYDFKRATGSLVHDVEFISKALRRDPNIWRMNRAFHAVHVPSFLAVVSMLDSIDDMKSVNEDDRHQIYSSLHRAAQLASSARERIEQSALTEAQVELNVLADYAPASPEVFKKASIFERTRDSLFSASKTTFDGAKNTVEAIPNMAGSLKDGVTSSFERANAVSVLASNLQRTLARKLSDTVTKPIGMRLQASGTALTHGAGTGVGLGVMAAVLFPPLVPVSAGAGVLVALRSWKKEMQKAHCLNEQQREQRIAELQAERKAALLQLTNGAPSVQMETEELSLTLDAETGEADALILKGEHAGRTWSDLSPLEKAETVSLFAQGAEAILNILEFGSESF
ncbi:hypothetical protein J7413_04960 [Shimia sp. R10_1]|uniref:hypothetical protein n=1 Tax=Shimia sp. R10_1 TaxID=2821095 RepID=UPI001ADD087E|nr:hypothetical protein [Shimia sp. R10_1]MBO9472881.1 hypothetical protein [Shimia sp. R10_1]